jgi:hypothetical protein
MEERLRREYQQTHLHRLGQQKLFAILRPQRKALACGAHGTERSVEEEKEQSHAGQTVGRRRY